MIEAVFDSVSDGICVIDKDDYRIVKANKAFIATFGVPTRAKLSDDVALTWHMRVLSLARGQMRIAL